MQFAKKEDDDYVGRVGFGVIGLFGYFFGNDGLMRIQRMSNVFSTED